MNSVLKRLEAMISERHGHLIAQYDREPKPARGRRDYKSAAYQRAYRVTHPEMAREYQRAYRERMKRERELHL